MNPKESLAYFQNQQTEMLAELLRFVEMESPTTSKEAVDQFAVQVADLLGRTGMSLTWEQRENRGNHLIAQWTAPADRPKVLMIAHMDTVWEPGIFERMPITVQGDVASGPGIFDMKGGIIVALFALRLLKKQGLEHSNITLLLNSDEEEGSATSREIIEREAKDAAAVFILEPAGPDNSLKTKRRGTGRYRVRVHGKAAHAGVEPEKGVSAIQELAHQILEMQSWNGSGKGISVNTGLIHGGTRVNVIPAFAEATVDLRCDSMEDMQWLQKQFQSLRPKDPRARLEVEGGFDRPPLMRSEMVMNLYNEAAEIASSFDYPVREFWTGGASDGNFTAALGIPTLDGLGPEGAGAHALHEHILVSSLPKRTNLLYHLLRNRCLIER